MFLIRFHEWLHYLEGVYFNVKWIPTYLFIYFDLFFSKLREVDEIWKKIAWNRIKLYTKKNKIPFTSGIDQIN